MMLRETLVAVWRQALVERKEGVELEGKSYAVRTTKTKKLRTVEFTFGEHRIDGIEQNPKTASRWAKMAREGKRVMQFTCRGRYFANVAEGKLMPYPAWKGLGLPE